MQEAEELAKNTTILMNVSEFDNITDATDSLISTMQAFKYTAEDSMKVIDMFNEVGKQNCRDM